LPVKTYGNAGTVSIKNQFNRKITDDVRFKGQTIEKHTQDVPGTLSQPVAIGFGGK
jgi:hypothetical protein